MEQQESKINLETWVAIAAALLIILAGGYWNWQLINNGQKTIPSDQSGTTVSEPES